MSREELIEGYIRGLNKTELKARLGQHGITSKISRLNKKDLGDLLIKEVLYNSEQISFDFESLPEEVEVKEVVKVELNNQLCLPAPKSWIGNLESSEYIEYVGNEWNFDHTDKPTCLGWTKDQELELIIDRFYSMGCSDFMLENTKMFLEVVETGIDPVYFLYGTNEFDPRVKNRDENIKVGSIEYYEYLLRGNIFELSKLKKVKRGIVKKIHPDTCDIKYKNIENPIFLIDYFNLYIKNCERIIEKEKNFITEEKNKMGESKC